MQAELAADLEQFGFTQYEAKAYVTLIEVQVASARDIHKLTGIPRGRVYEVLECLVEKRFIAMSEGTPRLYSPLDIESVFNRLKREYARTCDDLADRLMAAEQERMNESVVSRSYELHTLWSMENQIRAMFRRCRDEIIVFCQSPAFVQRYESDLRTLAKRVRLYVVVNDPEKFAGIDLRFYVGEKDILNVFLPKADDQRRPEVIILSDEKESLLILRERDTLGGIMVTNGIFGKYIQQSIRLRLKAV